MATFLISLSALTASGIRVNRLRDAGATWDAIAALQKHKRHKSSIEHKEQLHPSGKEAQKIKFFAYPPKFKDQGYLSYWYGNLTKALRKSERQTENPAEAEVFFLGMDTCCELNWPSYTSWPEDANYKYGNPTKCWDTKEVRQGKYLKTDAIHLQLDDQAARSPMPKYAGNGTHIIIDMRSWVKRTALERSNKQPIIWAAPSFDALYYRHGKDISWPAKNLVHFDHAGGQVHCGKTKYLAVFKGTDDHPTRAKLGTIDNSKAGPGDVRVVLSESKGSCGKDGEQGTPLCGKGLYTELLTNTQFGIVIRGDTFYSYRFMEVLSAGVVPVIFSDKWVLPFFEILDYSKFAILIKEQDYAKTVSILRAIPEEKVCAMRKEALRVYQTYFATFDAQLEAVMQIFDARKAGTTRPLPINWQVVCETYPCPS